MKMTLPDDWDNIDPAEDGRPKPPADAYVCKIVDVSVNADRLRVNLDIENGNYKGYFADDFEKRSARSSKAYWGLQFSVPVNFSEPKNGGFYKRLFKRFVNTLEQSNQNFRVPKEYDTDIFKDKRFVAQDYQEIPYPFKPLVFDIFVNYRNGQIKSETLPDGSEREWFENGNKRKPGEPRPEKEQYDENGLCPVDDIDIPFD